MPKCFYMNNICSALIIHILLKGISGLRSLKISLYNKFFTHFLWTILLLFPTYNDEIMLSVCEDWSPVLFLPLIRGTDKQLSIHFWKHGIPNVAPWSPYLNFTQHDASWAICNLHCGLAWVSWSTLWLELFYLNFSHLNHSVSEM